MLVYQPSVSRIAVFECGPLLAFRRTRPTRVVRRRWGRRPLTGPVNTASNRGISGSPVRSKHPLEATRRVRSRDVWSVDGGGEPVDVGDRTLSWGAVEVGLELEVLSRPLGLPGAFASARVLELPSALLLVLLHEGTEPSAPPARRLAAAQASPRSAMRKRVVARPVTTVRYLGGPRWTEVMAHSWPRLPSEVPTCSLQQTPGRSWAPAPPGVA